MPKEVKKEIKNKPRIGVPLTYTKELGDEICLKVSTSPYGLSRLCKENPHWPCRQTIFEWRIKIPSFGDNYAKAKQEQVEILVDECLEISDDSGFDAHINEQGRAVCDSEAINRARLRIDTRKWLASNLAPKIYGDKKQEQDNTEKTLKEAIDTMKELADKCLKTPNQT